MSFSRFHLSDLHVHTPRDPQHRYGNVGGPTPNAAFATTLVEAHASAGVEVIAVTDHNSVEWYPELRDAGGVAGVYVFPGVEISVNGCHLTLIWDRTEEGYELAQQFLLTLWPPGDSRFFPNGDPRPVSTGQVLDVAKRAVEHRALVLAPHTTAKNMGLFAQGVCRNHDEVAQSGYVLGFDVHGNRGADVLKNPKGVFGNVAPSWFSSGDVRSLDEVGKRATYLKLAPEPTLEGLRQAFLMRDTRLWLPQSLHSKWNHVSEAQFLESPEPSWPRVEAIEIEGGFHSDLRASLAPGLNAIIGGKGTGKSTLIEILRYVIDGRAPLVGDGEANRRFNFKANAEARVSVVDREGEPYVVHRSGDDLPARLLRDGQETGVEVRRRFDVRIFGQRELQELANRDDVLREFVASQAGPQWEDALKDERDLITDLGVANAELDQIEATLDRMEEHVEELKDVDERLLRARDKGADSLVAESNALAEADQSVAAAVGWPSTVSAAVDSLDATLPAPVVANHPLIPEGLQGHLTVLAAEVQGAVTRLRSAVDTAVAGADEPSEEWEASLQGERSRLQAELADAGIGNPQELNALQKRKAELTDLVDGRGGAIKRKETLEAERKVLLDSLGDIRRQKSRATEEAARDLTDRVGDRVRVRTNPLADRSQLFRLFEGQLQGQGVLKAQLEKLVGFQPSAIAEAMRQGPGALEELGCSGSTASKVAELPAATARACEECDLPDEVVVEINLGAEGAENWMSVQDVSPGQRATALLALALASGTSPLIIDQPEDDLDNRYIYAEFVRVLGDVCKTRQVIVATHNANVAVLGDAELVLALDADAGRSRTLALGALESPSVAETARTILEGGDEAFEARHRRYRAAERRTG
ncbi:MAG: AAA family ATPase [Chloroflexi bacterium]|nr:AAA family ATPase [Chloroflexota bacterium]